MSIELKLFLNKRNARNVYDVDEDKRIIKDYLNRVQQWGHFEISLFSNCLDIFNSGYIRRTFSTLLKRTKLLSSIAAYQNDISIFLNNCIVLSFERKQFMDAHYYVNQLAKMSEDSPRKAYDRLMYQYYLELLKALSGQNGHPNKISEQFRNLGFSDHADELSLLGVQILGSATEVDELN